MDNTTPEKIAYIERMKKERRNRAADECFRYFNSPLAHFRAAFQDNDYQAESGEAIAIAHRVMQTPEKFTTFVLKDYEDWMRKHGCPY